jgi:hypothetical protein
MRLNINKCSFIHALHCLEPWKHCPDPDFVKRSADWMSVSVGEFSLPRCLHVAASQPQGPDALLQMIPRGYSPAYSAILSSYSTDLCTDTPPKSLSGADQTYQTTVVRHYPAVHQCPPSRVPVEAIQHERPARPKKEEA